MVNVYFKISLSLLFIFNSLMLVAQTKSIQLRSIDSALTVTDTTRDVYLKIGLLGKISYAYQYIDFDKSVLFADSVVRLSKENDYKFGLAKGYNFLGLAYQTIGKLDLALKNYLKSLYINKNQGILKESGKNLNNIASVLIAIGDIESAKKYANEAYEVNKEFRNSNSLAISLSIFSDIAYKEKDLKKAISYLKKARRVQADNSSIFDDGFYHTKMGELYSAKGVKDSAEFAFYKVLGYQNAEPDQVIKALIGLSTIRLEQNRLNESENFLSKALQIAKTSNAQLELISVYNALVNLNIKKEDYKEALNYTKIKDELKDKVLGYNTSGQISSSLNKIITDQKDQENDDLRLFAQFKEMELKKQNTISILLVAGISITIFLGILLYINFLNKNKAYHQLDIANKTIQKQNQDLEQIIALRTETIRKKNEKLKELAYFNSHQIRKHTANILGLILISGFEDNKNQYFRMIENEAKSLEDVIEQINEMTSD